jgi:uncharacterized protein
LMWAAGYGNVEGTYFLLKHKVAIDRQDDRGMSALMLAVKSGQTGVVAELLDAGADRELKDKEGLTAFDYASAIGSADLVKMIEERAKN